MTDRKLPNDIARCSGSGEPEAWRAGCEDCRRRTDRSTFPLQVWMAAPPLVDGKCEARLGVNPTTQPPESAR